jgi:hypothetical protein
MVQQFIARSQVCNGSNIAAMGWRARGEAEVAIRLLVALGLVAGCERRERTRNSQLAGDEAALEPSEPRWQRSATYRFVSTEQTLADARRAAAEERWSDAAGAAEALLAAQPDRSEARTLDEQARLEGPNQARFRAFEKAAAASDLVVASRHYHALAPGSRYHERARVRFEKARDAWIDSQEADARAFAQRNRCDDARRVVRTSLELFPEARARLEAAASGCRLHPEAKPEARAGVERSARGGEEKPGTDADGIAGAGGSGVGTGGGGGAVGAGGAVTSLGPASVAAAGAHEAVPAAVAPAGATPAAGAAPVAPAPTPATPLPAPRATPAPSTTVATGVATAVRKVPAGDLEALRVAGTRKPDLAAGAKGIAHRDGVRIVQMAVSLCLSERGEPTSVALKVASEYGDANDKLVADVRRWRFRPYLEDGLPVPVCTAYLFRYQVD